MDNRGTITTPSGGSVYLVGSGVANSGIINSPQGDVILAAGQTVKIFDTSTPGVRVEVTATDNSVVNLGQIIAKSGQIGIYGATLRNSGVINADQVVRGENGRIFLRASKDVTLDAGSSISASGDAGGSITVQAEQGTLLASGNVSATGSDGKGGDIALLGHLVGVTDHAVVDASGSAGGGTVLVGGDYQGANAAVQNAWRTFVGADATIKADATVDGDGGKVIVWSDDVTRFYGNISAKGGPQGGNGGFVETSSHNVLDASGMVDASALLGTGGRWLLDPSDVTITHGSVGTLTGGTFDPAGASGSIGDTQINAALNGGTDVIIQTTTGTGGTGAIVVNGTADVGGAVVISNTTGGTRGLTLNTVGTINMHAGASIAGSTGNALNVNFNATGGSTVAGTINNAGGTLSIGGNGALTLPGTIAGGTLIASTLTSVSGILDTVTIGSNLNLAGTLLVRNGLTLGNGVTFNIGNSILAFQVAGTQHLATLGSSTLAMAGGTIQAGNGTVQTLQIDAGVTVQGFGSLNQSSVSTIVNAGTILANTTGQTLTISSNVFTNSGTLSATARAR